MGFFSSQMWKVIEWTDDSSDTLVYRFPMNGKDIMTGSSLTVRESQVAIFVHEGKIADVFGPGRHKLETRNLPFLTAMGKVFFQGESRFRAEVYFINTKQFVNQKWGTKSPITMRDKDFGMVRIRGFGVFGFRVGDPKTFLQNLFGTNSLFTTEAISEHLRSMLISGITDTIAESKVSALDLSSNLQEFNEMCQKTVQPRFAELGLDLTNLTIENISFPEEIEKALNERVSLGILGDQMSTYTQKKAADALGDAAKNQGTMGSFVGIGMAQNLAGVFSQAQQQAQQPAAPKQPAQAEEKGGKFCAECGAKLSATAKFCPECGAKQAVANLCPKCGTEVSATAKFCPDCGEKLK